jgi:hypothetical protein
MKFTVNTSSNIEAGNVSLGMFVVSGALAAAGLLYFFTHTPTEVGTTSTPTPSSVQSPNAPAKYPAHQAITATVFWVGEGADSSNDFIHNRASAWMEDWVSAYGGIDDPENRCGYTPCDFTPAENSFYFALPFSENSETGRKSAKQLSIIPWYNEQTPEDVSPLKNRWIKVSHKDKVAYGQWEDVGPFGENDGAYVFGSAKPAEKRAGLDLSPAFADALGVDGRGVVTWQFIDEQDVPNGPWKTIVTRSNPKY